MSSSLTFVTFLLIFMPCHEALMPMTWTPANQVHQDHKPALSLQSSGGAFPVPGRSAGKVTQSYTVI